MISPVQGLSNIDGVDGRQPQDNSGGSREGEVLVAGGLECQILNYMHHLDAAITLPKIKHIYAICRQSCRLGRCGLTPESLQKVMIYFRLSGKSVVLDIGSGTGQSSMHISASRRGVITFGIEQEPEQHFLSLISQRRVLSNDDIYTQNAGARTCYVRGNIESVKTLAGMTHVHMFDLLFPMRILEHIANLFNDSSAMYLVSYRNPETITQKCGFRVTLLQKISVSLSGSSEGHTAYVYTRCVDQLRGRPVTLQDFDKLFQPAYEAVKAGSAAVQEYVDARCDEWLSSGRATRSKRKLEEVSA